MRVNDAIIQELRLRQGNVCPECGHDLLPDDLIAVDHRISRARGGKDHLDNFQATHFLCNSRKGKGRKRGEPGPVTQRYTSSNIQSICQRITEDEGAAEADAARRIHDWALGAGLRLRVPKSSKTGGLYFDYQRRDLETTILSLWGKGTVQLHLKDMGSLRPFHDEAEILKFASDLVSAVPHIAQHRGFERLEGAVSKNPEIYVWDFLDANLEKVDQRVLKRFFRTYDAAMSRISN
jgi:hypothetical protein